MKNRPPLLLAPALLLLAGCSLFPRPLVPVHYYSIDPPALKPRAGLARGQQVLSVRTLTADSRYRERIVVRKGGLAVGFHEYDRWVDAPAEMVTAVLRRTLEAAGVAGTVVDDRLVRRPDLTLDGRLTRFDEVHAEPAWTADCEVELVLKQADEGTVLLAARFAVSRPAKARTTAAVAEAMNAAVADVAAQAADAIAKALAAPRPAK